MPSSYNGSRATTAARLLRDFSWLIVGSSPNGRRSCWTDARARISSRACSAARGTSSPSRRSTVSGAAARVIYRRRRPTDQSRSRRRSITSSSRIRRSLFWNWRPGRTAAARWPTSSWNIGGCPGIGCSVRTYNSYGKSKSRSEGASSDNSQKRDVDRRAELIRKSMTQEGFREKTPNIFISRPRVNISITVSSIVTLISYVTLTFQRLN